MRLFISIVAVLLLFACNKSDESKSDESKSDESKAQQAATAKLFAVPPPPDRSKDQGF